MLEFTVLDTPEAVAVAAAQQFRALASAAIADRGHFLVALSGGSTPLALYRQLALDPASVGWEQTLAFFSDERFVGPDARESNVGQARSALLGQVPAQVFAVPTDVPSVADAALAYERQIVERLGPDPRFDLILLGLGDDGHTASLFPGKPALSAQSWVTSSGPGVLPPPVERVTFTFPLINRARTVTVLATGARKAQRLAQWRDGALPVDQLPIAGVCPTDGALSVLIDREAAGQ